MGTTLGAKRGRHAYSTEIPVLRAKNYVFKPCVNKYYKWDESVVTFLRNKDAEARRLVAKSSAVDFNVTVISTLPL